MQILGHAHVDDVVRFEVDLGRTAGPLDDERVKLLLQALQGRLDLRECLEGIAGVVLARAHVPDGPAREDDLRAGIARRLQEHGIHVHHRLKARRLRLRDLRAAHLKAVLRDIRVECHVLRLERHNTLPLAVEDAAERRRQDALADMRARAHEHNGFQGSAPFSLI